MEDIRQYLLSIVAAAIIAGLCVALTNKKSTSGILVKMIAGLFLTTTVIAPWTHMRFNDLNAYFTDIETAADSIIADSKHMAQTEVAAIIKERTEAYILDKAISLKLDIAVAVTLTDDAPPIPNSVEIKGNASPYVKQQLKKIIRDDLGIPEEQQIWT